MAQTAVKDVVIWAKHIHGDDEVGRRVLRLKGGETVDLLVDGMRGAWRKMDDGRDGRPTNGIRPIGRMQDLWRELYAQRRGDLVDIALASEAEMTVTGASPLIYPARARNEEERQIALQSLLSIRGYQSDGVKMTRDEMNDRELDRQRE